MAPPIAPATATTAVAPALAAAANVAPPTTAKNAPPVNTVAAAAATTAKPINTPVPILPNKPELFFLKWKEYLDKKPSEI